MVDRFPEFARMVARSFQDLARNATVFVADVEGDALCAEYLAAFPEGSDPLFKTRSEHDCSCCKQFIRRAGSVVLADGALLTVWDRAAEDAPEPYRHVASRLRDVVRAAKVRDLFRVSNKETSFGAAVTRSLDKETQRALTWNHFHTGEIPVALRAALPDTARGDYRTTAQVFERGLVELAPDAVDAVLSLIE